MSDDTQEKNVVDGTAVAEALKSAERYSLWRRQYVAGAGRGPDRSQEEVITLAAEVRRLREERSEWMLQLKNLQSGLAGDGHVEAAKRLDQWIRTDPDEASVLTDEIQRLRELGYAHIDRAERIEADRDQLSASNLRLVAEREQLKAALVVARGDAAHWMAEHDKLKAEVERQKWMRNDSREQGKSLVEHLQTENAKLRDALVAMQEQYRNTVSSLRIVTAEAELRLPR